jgi:UDP-N-acetyl-D-mannosaminuronate dehydrogenase
VFATVDALREAGAEVVVQDPMYTADELAGFGWESYAVGEPVDVVVVQADHADYRELSAADFPGVAVVVDGRRVLDPARFDGGRYLVVGAPEAADAPAVAGAPGGAGAPEISGQGA